MNLRSGKIETFAEFSQFECLNEFNHHMEQWMAKYKNDFTKGERIGLKRLVRYSAKIPGVSNAKIGTILKAIHEEYNDNGISRSTFKRMISKAKEFGIFTVYETERKNGWQSSNLYVFNRFPSNEPPKQMNQPNETSNLFKTEKDQKNNKRKEEAFELDHTFVSNRVPEPFVQLVHYFYSEAKTIEEYWHMAKIIAHGFDFGYEEDLILEVAIDSFRQLIRKIKLTGNVKNPIAYYYGIMKNKFFDLYEQIYCKKEDYATLLYSALYNTQ